MMTSALLVSASRSNAALDFVRDVRDDLHGFAEIVAFALVVEHGLVNLAAGEVVHPRELGAGEPLVMAEVEVGLRAVVEHIHLAVLIRAHRAGIHVEIRIELLQRDLEAAIFEQGAERGGGQAFAERTHHTAGDEYEFHFKIFFNHGLTRINTDKNRYLSCNLLRTTNANVAINAGCSKPVFILANH